MAASLQVSNANIRQEAPGYQEALGYNEIQSFPGELARLNSKLRAQDLLIQEQAASLAHYEKIFERAADAARIGVWECSLPDGKLRWSDQVYELFDLQRGSDLTRDAVLSLYSSESLQALQKRRAAAILERSGFSLDAEIMTPKGRRRWIRVTATVECDAGIPVRIFGMKQDITDEKVSADRTRYLAEFDILTGLANRASFQTKLSDLALQRKGDVSLGALLLIDLDNFKQINDSFGHTIGDECLKNVATRLHKACPDAELVARIGGDEFAMLLGAPISRCSVETIAQRIVDDLWAPMRVRDCSFQAGASVGIARRDRGPLSDLFAKADVALYAAKAAGRNTFRTYDPKLMCAKNVRRVEPDCRG